MANNDINKEAQAHIDQLMVGLNGITSLLDKAVESSRKNMTSEQAMEFAKQMGSLKIADKIQEIKNAQTELKKEFNI